MTVIPFWDRSRALARGPATVRLLAASRYALLVLLMGGAILWLGAEDVSVRAGGLAALSALMLVRRARGLPDAAESVAVPTTPRRGRGLPDVRFTWSLSTGWEVRPVLPPAERPRSAAVA
jgi:hypothetical protein